MIWECKIGDADDNVRLKMNGIDLPMREAVAAAYFALTGDRPDFIFSGWAATLTPGEQEIADRDIARRRG